MKCSKMKFSNIFHVNYTKSTNKKNTAHISKIAATSRNLYHISFASYNRKKRSSVPPVFSKFSIDQ